MHRLKSMPPGLGKCRGAQIEARLLWTSLCHEI
jgi:hypothetical protein